MKDPYRSYEAAGSGVLEVFGPSGVSGRKGGRPLLGERDELERKLEERAAELARMKEALRGEIAKRERAEKALREAEENYRILMGHTEEGVRIIQKMREQFQEANVRSSRGKTLITAFLHDLKGPLALISSCAQFCLGNGVQRASLEKNLKIIYEGTQRANDLTKKFLEVFEVEMLRVEPVKIREIIGRAWEAVQQDTQALEVSFEVEVESELPEVMGNSEGLERVFFNLFLNAVQAISPTGRVGVEVEYLPLEKVVEVRVVDDGPGIPREYRRRVFDHFFTTKVGGTGLGLSLCRAIVKQHGGEIEVDCPVGGGTQVSVRLPVAETKSEVELTI
jgi:signal transduction histidine kinase